MATEPRRGSLHADRALVKPCGASPIYLKGRDLQINREVLWEIAGYDPHPKQLLFHNSPARFKVAACGRRFGKTKMSMMDGAPDIFELTRGRWWIVAEEYNVGEEDFTYLELMLEALQREFGSRCKPKYMAHNVKQGELFFEMPWGYRVEVKSARYPQTLVSKGLKRATLSEAAKLDPIVWEKYIRPALADYRSPADFTSTPEGDNWFKALHDQGQPGSGHRVDEGDAWEDSWESWNFPAWENPIVYPGGFDDPEVKAQMKTEGGTAYFWQEIGASFKALSGAVYPEFDTDTHVKPWTYDPRYANIAAWDFGFSNPTACGEYQIDDSGNWHLWREYYEPGESIHGHIAAIKARPNPPGYKVDFGIGDPADPGAIEEIARNLYPCYGPVEVKDFERGVVECSGLLKDMNGVPHFFVDPKCSNFIREIKGYKWPKRREDPTKTNEKPINYPNHALDEWRYIVYYMNVLGGKVRFADLYSREQQGYDIPIEPTEGEPETMFSLARTTVF